MRRNQPVQSTLRSSRNSRQGFTLVELMVVIGIIAVLASILVPVVSRAKKQARNVQCLANLRTLQTALMGFVNTNRHSVSYTPISITDAKAATNLRSLTWEGQLRPMYSNDAARLCPEATMPSDKPFGAATLAHGTLAPVSPAPVIPDDTYSYGSYGINGFLYYQDPAQTPAEKAGMAHAKGATPLTAASFLFDDITTLDGGAIPASVTTVASVQLPPGFGGAASVPVFGDCNGLDSWPTSTGITAGSYDPTASQGSYLLGTGDQGTAKGHSLGRFCLDRHPHGVNIVFLDGHAATIAWADLWQLRWNKSFVPVQVTDPQFKDR